MEVMCCEELHFTHVLLSFLVGASCKLLIKARMNIDDGRRSLRHGVEASVQDEAVIDP